MRVKSSNDKANRKDNQDHDRSQPYKLQNSASVFTVMSTFTASSNFFASFLKNIKKRCKKKKKGRRKKRKKNGSGQQVDHEQIRQQGTNHGLCQSIVQYHGVAKLSPIATCASQRGGTKNECKYLQNPVRSALQNKMLIGQNTTSDQRDSSWRRDSMITIQHLRRPLRSCMQQQNILMYCVKDQQTL